MSDEASKDPKPFDLPTLKILAELMSLHDMSEVDLSEGTSRIRLRRGPRVTTVTTQQSAPHSAPVASHIPAPAPTAAAPEKPTKHLLEIKSSMVGTFYNREKPESGPYVSVGSKVNDTTIVGLLEAMKLFNEVYAECSGVVTEVLVENQQFVEYGQVLFRVDPA